MITRNEIDEYYTHYLDLHTHPKCRLLHFIGQLFTLIVLGAFVYTGSWIYLFISPFVVYPFAWSAHFIFEKNKPAAFNDPIKTKICDFRMFIEILRGKLSIW